ncbi:TPA: tail fiber assembly protein [Yersinia enterocolitica]
MTVYGLIGSNAQDEPLEAYDDIPAGWVLMTNGRRPEDGVKYYASEDGKWIVGSSPLELKSLIDAAENQKSVLLSHASDMIGAISDEIEGLEGSEEDVPDKLRSDLKAWKRYRVAVKNIDVSLAPNIEWPVSPDAALTEA